MSNQVYANSMEVSCKQASGKSICAFPDVCMTPPQTPATPPGVLIPYPNTGMASDTTDGSSSVKISGQEVMLKNRSYFKKSTGDEGGCAPMKGVMTHKNMGKVYFSAWSSDVVIEGENVVRNLDLTTHNHGSYPTNSPTWPYLDKAQFESGGICDGVDKKFELQPHSRSDCPKGHSAHHVIPNRQFAGSSDYTRGSAPCLCASGLNQHALDHGEYHEIVDSAERMAFESQEPYTYGDSKSSSLESIIIVNELEGESGAKTAACVEAQLDNYYKKRCGRDEADPVKKSGAAGKNNKLFDSIVEESGA